MMVEPSYSQEQMGPASQHSYACWQDSLNHQLQLSWLSLKEALKSNFTVLDNVQWFEVLEHKQGKSLLALEFMGLVRLANEKARMLSMGQRKRLQLARVIAMDRPIWLLD
nr:ABC transporter I family member 1 [Tanacetum cinerariifolium]